MHENVLTRLSDFFKAALRPVFKEGQEGKLHLPEDDESAFELLVNYAYATFNRLNINHMPMISPPDGKQVTIRDYLKLYILAHKYLIEDLENAVLNMVHDHHSNFGNQINPEDVEYVLQHCTSQSGMSRLLSAQVVHRLVVVNTRGLPLWEEAMLKNPDLAQHIMMAVWKFGATGIPIGNVKVGKKCSFHRHQSTKKCTFL